MAGPGFLAHIPRPEPKSASSYLMNRHLHYVLSRPLFRPLSRPLFPPLFPSPSAVVHLAHDPCCHCAAAICYTCLVYHLGAVGCGAVLYRMLLYSCGARRLECGD